MKPCKECGRLHAPIPKKTIIKGYQIIEVKSYPIIEAVAEEGTGFLTFYCEYCRKEHLHGQGNGHRVAHCYSAPPGYLGPKIRQSPFYETGYILEAAE
ncbi:hypothetical protein MUP77_09350 [Candidatus Bathyarchaeota archaeon]|nr:hypothetical protein [Candidatus Bathyarchaeota archaeon]